LLSRIAVMAGAKRKLEHRSIAIADTAIPYAGLSLAEMSQLSPLCNDRKAAASPWPSAPM
jgi:hypothetical protein